MIGRATGSVSPTYLALPGGLFGFGGHDLSAQPRLVALDGFLHVISEGEVFEHYVHIVL